MDPTLFRTSSFRCSVILLYIKTISEGWSGALNTVRYDKILLSNVKSYAAFRYSETELEKLKKKTDTSFVPYLFLSVEV